MKYILLAVLGILGVWIGRKLAEKQFKDSSDK